jgi:hypothetical protein
MPGKCQFKNLHVEHSQRGDHVEPLAAGSALLVGRDSEELTAVCQYFFHYLDVEHALTHRKLLLGNIRRKKNRIEIFVKAKMAR